MAMVIDASVTAAWLLEDENEPEADRSFDALDYQEAFVPQLWHFETRNALLVAERRGRIQLDELPERLSFLNSLPIQTDYQPNFDAAMQLARTHRLTFYDALYLELAKRRNAQLATLDNSLATAAANEGVLMTV